MSTLRSSRALCAAATLLLACGARPRVATVVSPPAPPTPQAAASPPASPELHPPRAHYVAREPVGDATGLGRCRAPRKNELPECNVRLAPDSIGFLDRGHRYTFHNNQLAAADDSGAQGRLVGFLQVPDGFGGGFVFYEKHTAYFAKTFAGSLVRLGDHPMSDFTIGPRCILIRDGRGHGWLFGLDDAKPIAKAPSDLERLLVHPSGFMVGASDKGLRVYFAQEAGSWRELAIKEMADGLVEEDDILVSDVHDNVYRVRRDGSVVAAKKDAMSDADERMRAAAMSAMGLTESDEEAKKTEAPAPPLTAVPTEEALLSAGSWVPSMRAEDEWFGVHQDRVYIARTRTGEIRALGPILESGEECVGRVLSGRPLLVCMTTLGTRLRVFRVDLGTGERLLENEVNVTQGTARRIFNGKYYPWTVVITASCEGDARGGMCVRGSDGHYSTYKLPDSDNSYIFPGEVIQAKDDGRGGLGLSRLSNGKVYAFDATAINAALHLDAEVLSGKKFPPFIESGALLTQSSLRLFHIPNPFKPLPPSPVSYAIDLPLDGSGKVRLLQASGVVVDAGAHGLRLDAGKLYETNDGWTTWYEVASPPSGAPENLAGATCDVRGCLLGPWARIGWQRPNGLPEPVAPLLEPVARKKTTSGAKP